MFLLDFMANGKTDELTITLIPSLEWLLSMWEALMFLQIETIGLDEGPVLKTNEFESLRFRTMLCEI